MKRLIRTVEANLPLPLARLGVGLLLAVLAFGCCSVAGTSGCRNIPPLTPTVSPLLSPTAPSSPLAALPLNAGSTWVYSATVYETPYTATYRITDTVLQTREESGDFIAGVERTRQLVAGEAPPHLLTTAHEPGVREYVISGTEVYLGAFPADLAEIGRARLVYRFPLTGGSCWQPDPELRASDESAACNRFVEAADPAAVKTPAGEFESCYWIITSYLSGGVQEWFCDGVGVVRAKFDHNGTAYGYEEVLIDYRPGTP